MKILWSSLLVLLLAFPAAADNWDCMTEEEAKAIKTLLTQKMPFFLDYCDCCETDATLVRARNVEIVACPFEEGMFSVAVTGDLIAVMPFSGGSFEEIYPASDETGYTFETNVSLNYSFGINSDGTVQTIAALIAAETWNDSPCQEEISYPEPAAVENEAYANWFKRMGLSN